MDMKISGAGAIGAGEYDNVHISGSAKGEGLILCESFHLSGSFSGGEIALITETSAGYVLKFKVLELLQNYI